MYFCGITNDRYYWVLLFCFVAVDCTAWICRVETRPTGNIVGWVLTEYDWPLTVGLKPDLRGIL
jgi:hypothetical protein